MKNIAIIALAGAAFVVASCAQQQQQQQVQPETQPEIIVTQTKK